MKRMIPALAMAIVLASAFQAASAANVVKLRDHGPDGPNHYYSVSCSNGAEGSVTVYSKPRKVCAVRNSGKENCRSSWKVESAARDACR